MALALAPPAQASQFDALLAPEEACPGQSRAKLKRAKQIQTMLCMVQYARGVVGLPPLKSVKKLRRSAKGKAKDMRRCQELRHTVCGRETFYWFRHVGFFKGTARGGENLAVGWGSQRKVRSTMRRWMRSRSHREQMLRPRFDRIGASMVRGAYRRHKRAHFWAVHLGWRR